LRHHQASLLPNQNGSVLLRSSAQISLELTAPVGEAEVTTLPDDGAFTIKDTSVLPRSCPGTIDHVHSAHIFAAYHAQAGNAILSPQD